MPRPWAADKSLACLRSAFVREDGFTHSVAQEIAAAQNKAAPPAGLLGRVETFDARPTLELTPPAEWRCVATSDFRIERGLHAVAIVVETAVTPVRGELQSLTGKGVIILVVTVAGSGGVPGTGVRGAYVDGFIPESVAIGIFEPEAVFVDIAVAVVVDVVAIGVQLVRIDIAVGIVAVACPPGVSSSNRERTHKCGGPTGTESIPVGIHIGEETGVRIFAFARHRLQTCAGPPPRSTDSARRSGFAVQPSAASAAVARSPILADAGDGILADAKLNAGITRAAVLAGHCRQTGSAAASIRAQ